MDQRQMVDSLYEENLYLGNKINILNDENNFYRIQINNFNKLTNSINKDMYKLGLNFQRNEKLGDIVKVGPLFVISNKIKLKNLQMKVGNSIRQTEKFKKSLEGSLPTLVKKIQLLEEEISGLVGKCTKISLENKLMENVDRYDNMISDAYKDYIERTAESDNEENGGESLEDMFKNDIECTKKLEQIKKQQKQKIKILHQLRTENANLQEEVENLKKTVPNSYETNCLMATEAKQLEFLRQEEERLIRCLQQEAHDLQIQYNMNNECKQKIADRKEQENKEIKVLEEEVMKCREQVKEVKMKYKEIQMNTHKKSLLKIIL